MDTTPYGLRIRVSLPFEAAVARATEALSAQGFGVLTTIDMQQALKEKLGKDIGKYVILGACNPPLAARALDAEPDIGLLLPCNVIVYETAPGASTVAAMAPLAALSLVANVEIAAVAEEADRRLRAALATMKA